MQIEDEQNQLLCTTSLVKRVNRYVYDLYFALIIYFVMPVEDKYKAPWLFKSAISFITLVLLIYNNTIMLGISSRDSFFMQSNFFFTNCKIEYYNVQSTLTAG